MVISDHNTNTFKSYSLITTNQGCMNILIIIDQSNVVDKSDKLMVLHFMSVMN